MKHRLFQRMLALICVLLLTLSGCFSTEPEQTAPSELTPAQLYSAATTRLNMTDSLSFTVTQMKIIQYGGQQFLETTQQKCKSQNMRTDDFAASIDKTILIGGYTIHASQILTKDNRFLTVGNASFYSQRTESHDCTLFPALPEPSNYSSVNSAQLYGRSVLAFAHPTAAESWALPSGATLQDAAATVVLDSDGALTESIYSIQYTNGESTVTERIHVTIRHTEKTAITVPENTAGFVALEAIDTPILLEKACGYLLQAVGISTEINETIESQASGISRSQTTQLRLSGSSEDLAAQINTDVTLINASRGGETTTASQAETFREGKYTVITDGAEAESQETVAADSIHSYCNDILVGNILLPHYITSAASTQAEDTIELTFQASEELAGLLCSNACQSLYQDPDVLNELATEYTTQQMTFRLILDAATGFPLSCGLSYSGNHVIEGSSYSITSQTEQTFALIDTAFE